MNNQEQNQQQEQIIDVKRKFSVNGKIYTIEQFMAKINSASIESTLETLELLVEKGRAKEIINKTKDEKIFDKVQKEIDVDELVKKLDEEEELEKQYKRNKDIDDNESLLNVKLTFAKSFQAQECKNYIKSLGIEDVSMDMDKDLIFVIAKNITAQEYTKISRKYALDKAIDSGVKTTEKIFNSTADAVNYTATKILSPVASIGVKAGMNIGKGLFHTATRFGASLINNGSKAIKETQDDLNRDPELIRAKKELIDVKNGVLKKFNNGSTSSGIETF